jgi:hypothetical protein
MSVGWRNPRLASRVDHLITSGTDSHVDNYLSMYTYFQSTLIGIFETVSKFDIITSWIDPHVENYLSMYTYFQSTLIGIIETVSKFYIITSWTDSHVENYKIGLRGAVYCLLDIHIIMTVTLHQRVMGSNPGKGSAWYL